MLIFLIIGILFLAAAIYNAFTGEYAEAAAGAGVFVVTLLLYLNQLRIQKINREFTDWIMQNRETLRHGSVPCREGLVGYDTELVQFEYCLSVLIFSITEESRFLVRGQDNIFLANLVYSGITLLGGWWGVPWGPILTVKILYRNLRGGATVTVAELIELVEAGEQMRAGETDATG